MLVNRSQYHLGINTLSIEDSAIPLYMEKGQGQPDIRNVDRLRSACGVS